MARPDDADLSRAAESILRERGFILDGPILADGNKHYCNTSERPRGRKASYTITLDDQPRIRLKWWYRPEPDNWEVVHLCEAAPMTPEQRRAWKAKAEAARAKMFETADAVAKQEQDKLLKRCVEASGAEAYLKAKHIPAVAGLYAQRHGDVLIVAGRNADGEVRFLQRIYYSTEDGGFVKSFPKGCLVGGCFFEIPPDKDAPADIVFIVEGVATGIDVWRATGCRVIVAFNCGNLLPVARALIDAGKLIGEHIVFIADNDWFREQEGKPNDGLIHAIQAARAVGGRYCVPIDTPETFPDSGKPMTDANDFAQVHGIEALAEKLETAETPTEPVLDEKPLPVDADMFPEPNWQDVPDYICADEPEPGAYSGRAQGDGEDEPLPLRRPMPPQADYPVGAFGPFADAVRVMASHCYVPASIAGGVVLSVLSMLAQRIWNAKSRRYTTPLSLNLLFVLESGGGKDDVEDAALKVIREWEDEQEPRYEGAMEAYRLAERVHQKSVKMLEQRYKGANGFDAKQYAQELKELEATAPKAPVMPLLTSGNINLEGLYRKLHEETPSHCILSSDAGLLFGGYAFSSEHRIQTMASLCELWSKGVLDKLRMVEGASRIKNRRVCSCLMVQPVLAEALFKDTTLEGQGYMCRNLVSWPRPMRRDIEDVDVSALPEMQPFYDACRELLALKPPQNDEPGQGLEFRPMAVKGKAFALYQGFLRELEDMILPESKYEPIRGYARRGAEQAVRIAGVLSGAWSPSCDEMLPEAMESGIAIARWHLDEVLRIALTDAISPEIKRAEALMQFFVRKGIFLASTSQIMLYGPSGLRDKASVDSAVNLLVEHGWLKPAGPGEVWMGEGRPFKKARRTWIVRPGYVCEQ